MNAKNPLLNSTDIYVRFIGFFRHFLIEMILFSDYYCQALRLQILVEQVEFLLFFCFINFISIE